MWKKFIALTLFSAFSVCIFAQGLDTRASKDDWEEINFEFNSAVLSDGFPSLLRLAELLRDNPKYRVRIEGHADGIGSDRYNERLGMQRANMVRDFLTKYGANANQIETSSRGKRDPKVAGERRQYSRTDVARWMNRRAVISVLDEQGRTVGVPGGVGQAIDAMPKAIAAMEKCCDEILKRLDRLDEIARMLRDMADQNAGLRKEVDSLKQQQAALQSQINAAPKPLTEQQTASVIDQRLEAARDPRFSLLGVNLGADSFGHVTFTGRARYFAPFRERFAIQAQGEYFYFREAREGQFDLGLVTRPADRFQAGLFSSFKHVTLRGNQSAATLGQAALTLDYIFRLGRLGVFGTKSFMDGSVINRANAGVVGGRFVESCVGQAAGTCQITPNVFLERYIGIVDQAGISTALGLWGNNYLEGNVGYLRSRGYGDKLGGTLRFVFPVGDRVAFTMEGGVNETMLSRQTWGRAVFGVQFGNFQRPKEFLGSDRPIPVDVPRVRYEVLSRRVQDGAAPPVADAGPDQIGVPAGTITLNGSNSYDPNGEPLTFSWVQEGGPNVALSGANQAVATFTAVAGQAYTFRLTVRNQSGLSASARTRVSTRAEDRVQVIFFTANPPSIRAGQQATLFWRVINAETVTISGIGQVGPEGSAPVSPTQSTTYTLTARNAISEANATATVNVEAAQARIFGCFATPTNIRAGEAATIQFQTENITGISVTPNVPGVAVGSTSFVASPTQTTTYVINVTGANNQTAACTVVVTVDQQQVAPPRIVRFTAAPTEIVQGEASTLVWQVENATRVDISGVGENMGLTGTQEVRPNQTTTYTLTAVNASGTSTATATVTVLPGARITSFTANPNPSPQVGGNVVLTCIAENATSVTIAGAGPVIRNQVVVNPRVDTTYTCTAVGTRSQDTQTVTVRVDQPLNCDVPNPPPGCPPRPEGPPPTVVITGAPVIETVVRTLTLDASQSFSPGGFGPLRYLWTAREGRAAIANATSPTPIVYLGNLYGDYFFDVTVTDARGNVATSTVNVRLVVTRIP
jgi:hypothetical protein